MLDEAGVTVRTRRQFDAGPDATYEGDLAAAGALYRIGREGRDEYDEPFACVVYKEVASTSTASSVESTPRRTRCPTVSLSPGRSTGC